MEEMSAFNLYTSWSVMSNRRVGSAVYRRAILCGPGESNAIFICQFLHVFANLDFGHADFNEIKCLLINLVGDFNGFSDACLFGRSLSPTQGRDDGLSTHKSICVRSSR